MKFPTNLQRSGATLAGIFSAALMSALLLCGAGNTPTGNVMSSDVNANGHNLTNAATISATNVIVTGSLTAPTAFRLPATALTGTLPNAVFPVTLPAISGVNITSIPYANLTGTPSTYNLPNASTSSLGGVIVGNGLSINTGTITANVISVAGRTGAIALSATDISGLATSATTDTTNAGNIISGMLAMGRIPVGTTSTTVAAGNDSRFPASVTGVRLGNGAGGSDTALVIGTGLSLTSGTLTTTGVGSVTSVSLSVPGAIYSVSGSPVTSTGTLTLGLLNQSANNIFAGPASGSAGVPGFRALVSADIPNNAANTTGSAASFTGSLSGDVSGTQGATQVVSGSHLSAGTVPNAALASTPLLPTGSGASLTGMNGYASESLSAAQTGTLTVLGRVSEDTLALAAGTSAYIVNKVFSPTGAQTGDLWEINVSYPASTNPTLNFYDASTGGTLLQTKTANGTAGTTTLQFVFNGTHWVHYAKGALLTMNLGANVQTALTNSVNGANGPVVLDTNGNIPVSTWTANANNQTFYLEGSSIDRGHGLTGAQLANGGLTGNYFNLLMSNLPWGKNHGTSYNDGVDSSTTTQALARYTTGNSTYTVTVPSPHSVFTSATGQKWFFLSMTCCYNDAAGSITTTTSAANITSLIADAHADGALVVLLTCPVTSAQASFVNTMNQMARGGSFACDILVDMADWIPNDSDTTFYQSGGLHPNAQGHVALAVNLDNKLLSYGGKTQYQYGFVPVAMTANQGLTINNAGLTVNAFGGNFGGSITSQYSPGAAGSTATIVSRATQTNQYADFSIWNSSGTDIVSLGYGNSTVGSFVNSAYLFTRSTSTPLLFGINLTENMRLSTSGNLLVGTTSDDGSGNKLQVNSNAEIVAVGKTVSLKGGTNALSGTVTLASGAGSIISSAITTSMVIVPTMKTVSGTPGTASPLVQVFTGSATFTGLSTDNSTYNWGALQVNQ